MKKLFILLTLLVSCVAAQAQWSVGLDACIAPWGSDNKKHMGTDITLNYRLPVSSFYVMPSVGLFYTNFFEEADWDGGKCYGNSGYQTGFDFALVVGKSFGVGIGKLSVFTGPRYAYAFASKSNIGADYVPHNFDWRIGVDYSISKFTISAKIDIATLKLLKDEEYAFGIRKYSEHQVPTLAVGLAYHF